MELKLTDEFLKARASAYDKYQFQLSSNLPKDFSVNACSVFVTLKVCDPDALKIWNRTLYFHHFINGHAKELEGLLRTTKAVLQLPSIEEALYALLYFRILLSDFERYEGHGCFILDDIVSGPETKDPLHPHLFGKEFLAWWLERASSLHVLKNITSEHRTWSYAHLGPCDYKIVDEHFVITIDGEKFRACPPFR